MKHFVFTIEEGKVGRAGNYQNTVRVYRIIKGEPQFIGERKYAYESEFQAAFTTLMHLKALPKKAFERSVTGGFANGSNSTLKAKGIATLVQIT